jgi:radical SAM superfamily enzyme YgiQ (UPF0313 family)
VWVSIKPFNRTQDYPAAMQMFHEHGVVIQGCFIFGIDDDDNTIFSETVDTIRHLRIDIPRFAIYTPYPGTKAFLDLKAEGRILHEDWDQYDTQHVVFQPAQMTPDELYKGFRWAYKQTFTRSALLNRTFSSPHPIISLLGNTAYRLYVRKLCAAASTPLEKLTFSSSVQPKHEPAVTAAHSGLHAGGNPS